MNQAGLDRGDREHRRDTVGQALEPVTYQEEHITHAAVLDLSQHREPELRRLPAAAAGPQAQHVTAALQVDPDRGIEGLVADLAVADLDHDRVDEHGRIDRGCNGRVRHPSSSSRTGR